jgi:hypothetical protein
MSRKGESAPNIFPPIGNALLPMAAAKLRFSLLELLVGFPEGTQFSL